MRRWTEAPLTHSNVYGLARSLLALSLLLTLLLHSAEELFYPFGSVVEPVTPLMKLSLFALAGEDQLELARWAGILILGLVVLGWRPRLTGVLHYWVAFSFTVSGILLEGGDQIGQVVAALLIPVTLTDGRKWHWGPPPRAVSFASGWIARSAWWVVRLQVALVYFHAFVGKLAVEEWRNGTAVYYWFTHPTFGLPAGALDWAVPLLAMAPVVMALTWGAFALEVAMFMSLVTDRRWWPYALAAGLGFHFMIALAHGLGTFFLSMAGALVLYLRPPESPLPLRLLWRRLATAAGRVRTPRGARAVAAR